MSAEPQQVIKNSVPSPETPSAGTRPAAVQPPPPSSGSDAPVPGGLVSRLADSGFARWITDSWTRILIRIVAVAAALGLWHIASTMQWSLLISFQNVPVPLEVWGVFLEQLQTSEFYTHIMVSMRRILIGYALAAVTGILIGILMGRYRVADDVFSPYIEILRPIPAVAWIPLAILMMPTEESSIIFITYLGAFFPIVLNTVHGVEQTPAVLIRAARCFGAGNAAILRHVILPGALPSIVTGLSIGMGVSWFSLLAGEIISGQYGIGYFTWASYTLVEYPNIIIGMLVIGALGTLSTMAVRYAAKPLLKWQGERARG